MTSLAAEFSTSRVAIGDFYSKLPHSVWFSIAVTWAIVYVLAEVVDLFSLLLWAGGLTLFSLVRFS